MYDYLECESSDQPGLQVSTAYPGHLVINQAYMLVQLTPVT